MRDEDKPYVCIRHGWIVQITPRNGAGWRGLIAWMALLALLTGGYVALAATEPGPDVMLALAGAFLVLVAGWAWAMIRWMKARSEFVDMNDLEAFKRSQRKSRRR
ncbi:MAG: hypothetical protein B7Y88_11680 [Sphingomonadales bacterium 32-64-17]|nr:MAG: hypothetical protein B7Y88_11680 [Sphingomonadales bacterium 32-64-17]